MWKVHSPCHPPFPPIGNMPPICNSSNPYEWYFDAGNTAANQIRTIQYNDIDLLEFSRRLTQAPKICDKQMVLRIVNTWNPFLFSLSLSIFSLLFRYIQFGPNFYTSIISAKWNIDPRKKIYCNREYSTNHVLTNFVIIILWASRLTFIPYILLLRFRNVYAL